MTGEATLSNEKNYTVFRFGNHVIRFAAPYSLEHYTEVKECDVEVDRGNEKVISLYWLVAFLDIGEFGYRYYDASIEYNADNKVARYRNIWAVC